MENFRMLTASECAHRYHITRSTWYRMVKQDEAPEPQLVGQQKVWALPKLVEWEEQMLAEYGFQEAVSGVLVG